MTGVPRGITRRPCVIVDRGDYLEIATRHGPVLIDHQDRHIVEGRSVSVARTGEGVPYAHIWREGRWRKLHREILSAPDGMLVDHRDHNGLNDRRHNLRLATHSQNAANNRKAPPAHGYRGVCWRKSDRVWRAVITVNRRSIQVGEFKDIVKAARAYDKAALKYHGEFARLNFPDSPPAVSDTAPPLTGGDTAAGSDPAIPGSAASFPMSAA